MEKNLSNLPQAEQPITLNKNNETINYLSLVIGVAVIYGLDVILYHIFLIQIFRILLIIPLFGLVIMIIPSMIGGYLVGVINPISRVTIASLIVGILYAILKIILFWSFYNEAWGGRGTAGAEALPVMSLGLIFLVLVIYFSAKFSIKNPGVLKRLKIERTI